jgi:hypothetical protein
MISAVASFSFPADSFNATYDMYTIKIYATASSGVGSALDFRLRAAGTDNTSSTYTTQRMISSGTTISGSRATTTSAYFGYIEGSTSQGGCQLDIYQPFSSTKTFFRSVGVGQFNNAYVEDGAGTFTGTNSFDSITILCSSNMTGKASLYGWNL